MVGKKLYSSHLHLHVRLMIQLEDNVVPPCIVSVSTSPLLLPPPRDHLQLMLQKVSQLSHHQTHQSQI